MQNLGEIISKHLIEKAELERSDSPNLLAYFPYVDPYTDDKGRQCYECYPFPEDLNDYYKDTRLMKNMRQSMKNMLNKC